MIIERILYINLDRRMDRNEWFRQEMEAAEVPMDIIERIPGKDWQDYPNSESIINAMHADRFAPYMTPKRWRDRPYLRGHFCYVWSNCICLRQIIESRKTTLVMCDDVAFDIKWDELSKRLHSIPDDINICQLEWFHHNKSCNPVVPYPADPRWSYGIHSLGDKAIIYNKQSATRMLALVQGCIEELNSIEGMIVRHFNNRFAFHPTDPFDIIRWAPHSLKGVSDIDPRENPHMLQQEEGIDA